MMPSREQLQAAARQLGLAQLDEKMSKLVQDMLKPSSLPKGWEAVWEASNDRWVYHRQATSAESSLIQLEHPKIEYYRGGVFMDKGGYRQLQYTRQRRKPDYKSVLLECGKLDILPTEDVYVQEVAELRLCCPLPPGWMMETDGSPPRVRYRNHLFNVVLDDHPLDPYFRELRDRRRKELLKRRESASSSSASGPRSRAPSSSSQRRPSISAQAPVRKASTSGTRSRQLSSYSAQHRALTAAASQAEPAAPAASSPAAASASNMGPDYQAALGAVLQAWMKRRSSQGDVVAVPEPADSAVPGTAPSSAGSSKQHAAEAAAQDEAQSANAATSRAHASATASSGRRRSGIIPEEDFRQLATHLMTLMGKLHVQKHSVQAGGITADDPLPVHGSPPSQHRMEANSSAPLATATIVEPNASRHTASCVAPDPGGQIPLPANPLDPCTSHRSKSSTSHGPSSHGDRHGAAPPGGEPDFTFPLPVSLHPAHRPDLQEDVTKGWRTILEACQQQAADVQQAHAQVQSHPLATWLSSLMPPPAHLISQLASLPPDLLSALCSLPKQFWTAQQPHQHTTVLPAPTTGPPASAPGPSSSPVAAPAGSMGGSKPRTSSFVVGEAQSGPSSKGQVAYSAQEPARGSYSSRPTRQPSGQPTAGYRTRQGSSMSRTVPVVQAQRPARVQSPPLLQPQQLQCAATASASPSSRIRAGSAKQAPTVPPSPQRGTHVSPAPVTDYRMRRESSQGQGVPPASSEATGQRSRQGSTKGQPGSSYSQLHQQQHSVRPSGVQTESLIPYTYSHASQRVSASLAQALAESKRVAGQLTHGLPIGPVDSAPRLQASQQQAAGLVLSRAAGTYSVPEEATLSQSLRTIAAFSAPELQHASAGPQVTPRMGPGAPAASQQAGASSPSQHAELHALKVELQRTKQHLVKLSRIFTATPSN